MVEVVPRHTDVTQNSSPCGSDIAAYSYANARDTRITLLQWLRRFSLPQNTSEGVLDEFSLKSPSSRLINKTESVIVHYFGVSHSLSWA